jgi:hypothetical protein
VPHHRNIRDNRNILKRLVASLDPSARDAMGRYLLAHCRVVVMKSGDVDYAHQIFLSINERGKPLTVEDIFQAELLGPLDRAAQERYAPIVGHIGKYKRENQWQNVLLAHRHRLWLAKPRHREKHP